jgi:transposase
MAVKLKLTKKQKSMLEEIGRSRTAPLAHVERARILLQYANKKSVSEISRQMRVARSTIYRLLNHAVEFGPMLALEDLPRPGAEPKITPEAKAWLVSVACQKPKDLGYAHEVWTMELLAQHSRTHCDVAGHPSLSRIRKGTVHKILDSEGIKPHKISYYLESRDPNFDEKMAEVLCVYKEVELLKKEDSDEAAVAIISYDEKPGIQAIANTAPDLPPVPGQHPNISRDHEYKRLGTVTLMAGINLLNGHVHHIIRSRHRSREFIEFLRSVDGGYPSDYKIRVILDNHSAHISKETRAFLDTVPGRFEFVFTPKHASWLNLIEVFFSKVSRTVLRHIRVNSIDELQQRLRQYIEELNAAPVVFKWQYGLAGSGTTST